MKKLFAAIFAAVSLAASDAFSAQEQAAAEPEKPEI